MVNPLPLLPAHLGTFFRSILFFYSIQFASHTISPRLVKRYTGFDRRTRVNWATHVVSMAHALIILPLAFKCSQSTTLQVDPVFGYDPYVSRVLAFTSGYFFWDTIDSALNGSIGFVVHGAACLAVYLFSFRPFLAGFGPSFLIWELSTPFLNIHWFMEKSGLSTRYPTFFLINSGLFVLVFFVARIVYGGYNNLHFFRAMWEERHRIPLHLHLIYCTGNLALNGLNWLWFSKIVKQLISRLSAENSSSEVKKTIQHPSGKSEIVRPAPNGITAHRRSEKVHTPNGGHLGKET